AVAVHDKARAEMLIADAREALKQEAPLDRVRTLTADLQQMYHGLSAISTDSGAGAGPGSAGRQRPGGSDDVIDAEFST
ncbi:MAG: molecular chaperone DnaK, partial [Actinomycetota bacterium]|nr:molecular chaperone DnaK [Actinomycetota bacterium]